MSDVAGRKVWLANMAALGARGGSSGEPAQTAVFMTYYICMTHMYMYTYTYTYIHTLIYVYIHIV